MLDLVRLSLWSFDVALMLLLSDVPELWAFSSQGIEIWFNFDISLFFKPDENFKFPPADISFYASSLRLAGMLPY